MNHRLEPGEIASLAASAHGFVGADIAKVLWVQTDKLMCALDTVMGAPDTLTSAQRIFIFPPFAVGG